MKKFIMISIILLYNIANTMYSQSMLPKVSKAYSNYNLSTVFFTFTEKNNNSELNFNENNEIVKNLVEQFWSIGKEMHFVDYEELKTIQKSRKSDILLVKIEHIHEYYEPFKQHARPKKPAIQFSYYSFTLYSPQKNAFLAKITNLGDKLDTLEIVTDINLLQYIIRNSFDGLTLKKLTQKSNCNIKLHEIKDLYLCDKIYGLPKLDSLTFFPEKIIKVTQSEILSQIRAKIPGSYYAVNTYEPGSSGIRFNTIIMDCASSEPLCIFGRAIRK
jgi:hypothetical protein